MRARSKTDVCDQRKARSIYEDVLLCRCQYSGGTKYKTVAYSVEIPMDHTTGVEVIETFGDIG